MMSIEIAPRGPASLGWGKRPNPRFEIHTEVGDRDVAPGDVFMAYDHAMRRPSVLRRFGAQALTREGAHKVAAAYGVAAAGCRHLPSPRAIYEVDTGWVVASDPVAGEPLGRFLLSHPAVSWRVIAAFGVEILTAVTALHRRGLSHGHLSEDVVYIQEGRAVVDWLVRSETPTAAPSGPIGGPCRGEAPHQHLVDADLKAVSLLIFGALVRRYMQPTGDLAPRPSVGTAPTEQPSAEHIPRDLVRIISHGLSHRGTPGWRSAHEMATALKAVLNATAEPSDPAPDPGEQGPDAVQRAIDEGMSLWAPSPEATGRRLSIFFTMATILAFPFLVILFAMQAVGVRP